MKPGAKRLGRGLGAFLDFGPEGDEGGAYVPVAASEDSTSVLETSTPAAAPAPAKAPAAPVPAPSPPPAPRLTAPPPPPPPPAPPRREPEPARPAAVVFEDEIVGGLTFPDVELD
jgi:hypothetical protein